MMKEYDRHVRPSNMVFKKMDISVRVLDPSLDMMNVVYGN
jgi:hypothetical protein